MNGIRFFILLALGLLPNVAAAYGLHNNSGTSSEDSITVAIVHIDSTGKNWATADSFFVAIFKSHTNDVVFRDSGTATMTGLDTMRTFGRNLYYYHRAIADIDGSGAVGQYEGVIIAKTNAGSGFLTPNRFSFQIMPADPRALVDSLFAVIDSIQNHENWRIRRADTAQHVLNTISLNNTDMGRVADSVWNKAWGTSFTAGSIGDTLNNRSPYTAAAKAIFDSTATRAQIAGSSADSVWAKPFSTSFTAGSMGDSLSNLSFVGGGSATITASDKRDIADSVWNKAWGTSFLAGSIGDTLNNRSPYTAAAKAIFDSTQTAAVIGRISADSVWGKAFSTSWTAGSMGDSINNISYVGGSSVFSTTQRDSLLAAATNASVEAKVWNADTTGNDVAGTFGRVNNGLRWPTLAQVADSVWNKAFAAPFTAGSIGDSLTNISFVGGSGSGNDSSSIARWVWNTPKANHQVAATFGRYLDTEVSGLASGSGAFGVTVVVLDTATDQVVPNVDLTIRNLTQTSVIAVGASSSLGTRTFNLNADQFVVTAVAPGYSFATPDTINVTGAAVDTIVGHQFDPGAPQVLGTCRVYAYLAKSDGRPETGATVSAYPVKGVVKAGDIVISPFTVQSTVESTGYFAIDLIWSSLLGAGGSQYELAISRKDGTILRKRITVPDSSSWLLQW